MAEITINFKSFPTTRYQGSKRKILYWIHACIKELDFVQVVDAFGGSASFSYLAKKMGKEVVYNDLMRFNFLIGKSLIENQSINISEKDINYVLDNNVIAPPKKKQKNKQNKKNQKKKNVWLDKIIKNINSLPSSEDDI